MPRKSSSSGRPAASGSRKKATVPKFAGYINYRPSSEDVARYEQLLTDGVDPSQHLDAVLDSGYKLGLGITHDNTGVNATLFDRNESSEFGGKILSANASTAYAALRKLLFIHVYIAEQDWTSLVEKDVEYEW